MWKNAPLLALLSLAMLVSLPQDSGCTTWERQNCKVSADSLVAAIDRGDTVKLEGCEVFGTLEKRGIMRSPISAEFSVFHDTVFFSSCVCMGEIDFLSAYFENPVIFSGITFEKYVRFPLCRFTDNTYFWVCTFKEGACFGPAQFEKLTSFRFDTVLGNIDFHQARFHQGADFIEVSFGGDARFLEAKFEDRVSFAHSTFSGKVNFTAMRFKGIEVLWEQIEDGLVCDTYTAFNLMRSFENKRMLSDVDGVYMFLKEQERIRKRWYVRYPERWLIQQTCGYGAQPERVLLLSVLIVLGFTFFFLKSDALTEMEERLRHSRRRRIWRRIHRTLGKRLYDAFYFRFQTFIIGVVPDWHPTDNYLIHTKRVKLFRFRTLAMIEGALGWILLVLFVVTLTRKFIR